MNTYISSSPEETQKIAAELAATLKGGEVIAFKGDLGMGKTCFTRGLAEGLGFKGEVNSPTFAIMNEYKDGRLNLYHYDMYRISSWEDLDAVGFFDYCASGGVVAVEWSENIEAAISGEVITITITRIDDNKRNIVIEREFVN